MMPPSPSLTTPFYIRPPLDPFQVGDLLPSHFSVVRSMYLQLHRMHARALPDRFTSPSPDLYSDSALLEISNHDNGFLLTARTQNNDVFGFISARFHTRRADQRRTRRTELCVDTIYVKPSLRGIRELLDGQRVHVASSLFSAVAAAANKSQCDDLVFDVWDFNHASMKFCMVLYQTVLEQGFVPNDWPIYFDRQTRDQSPPLAASLRAGGPSRNVKFYLPLAKASYK